MWAKRKMNKAITLNYITINKNGEAKCSLSEMLPVGYVALWRTGQDILYEQLVGCYSLPVVI